MSYVEMLQAQADTLDAFYPAVRFFRVNVYAQRLWG